MQSISLTTSWHYNMRVLLLLLEEGTPEGKEKARAALLHLADQLDELNGTTDSRPFDR